LSSHFSLSSLSFTAAYCSFCACCLCFSYLVGQCVSFLRLLCCECHFLHVVLYVRGCCFWSGLGISFGMVVEDTETTLVLLLWCVICQCICQLCIFCQRCEVCLCTWNLVVAESGVCLENP
jgi:hypothetical protein